MRGKLLFLVLVAPVVYWAISSAGAAAPGVERVPPIDTADFDRLLGEIKPQRGESPWRGIQWLTSITDARRRSAAEDKPLVIFTAADGSPLGRT
jgi:hypothetical protein